MSRPIGGDLSGYYRLHAPWYDLTRPFFLHGRHRVVDALAAAWSQARSPHDAPRVLEIGCGTGVNLARLRRRLPGAELHGLDLSAEMLSRARRRLGPSVRLVQQPLAEHATPAGGSGYDLILASYMLSMTGSGLAAAVGDAVRLLAPGGTLAVLDFHTGQAAFQRWMARNHVRMDGVLLNQLEARLQPIRRETHSAGWGLWHWMLWLGRQPA